MPHILDPVAGDVEVPVWVHDLDSFSRWVHSGVLPEKTRVHFIDGQVWVDSEMEELNSHNRVKAAIFFAFHKLCEETGLGEYFPDGMLLTNEEAALACEPDAMFATHETLESGRLSFTAGVSGRGKATEAVGTPDLVVEIVSRSSVKKDTDQLLRSYWTAGIPEYWLIDCRKPEIQFALYRHAAEGYAETPQIEGWIASAVLGKSFRLVRSESRNGLARYELEAK